MFEISVAADHKIDRCSEIGYSCFRVFVYKAQNDSSRTVKSLRRDSEGIFFGGLAISRCFSDITGINYRDQPAHAEISGKEANDHARKPIHEKGH